MITLNKYALQLSLMTAGLGLFALWPSLPSAQGQVDPDTIVLYAADAPRAAGRVRSRPGLRRPRVETRSGIPTANQPLGRSAAGEPAELRAS